MKYILKLLLHKILGYATNDAYHTIAVELIYHHWVWANEATSPRRSATSISVDNGASVDEFGSMPQITTLVDKAIVEGADDNSMPDADHWDTTKHTLRWPHTDNKVSICNRELNR